MSDPQLCLAEAPSKALVTPVPEAMIPSAMDRILGIPDLVSPMYWLLEMMTLACGTNPAEYFLEQFAGDWEGLARAASATRNLSGFYDLYHDEIRRVRADLADDWTGEAATAATTYLDGLSKQVALQADELLAVAKDLDQMAFGMDATLNAIISLASVLPDLLLVAAISAAAAAATAATGVGALLGGSATAVSLAAAASTWMEILGLTSYALTAVKGLTGPLAGLTQGVDGFTAVPLPNSS